MLLGQKIKELRMENGVFAECGDLTTISAPAGSYGETWALENEYLVINP